MFGKREGKARPSPMIYGISHLLHLRSIDSNNSAVPCALPDERLIRSTSVRNGCYMVLLLDNGDSICYLLTKLPQ